VIGRLHFALMPYVEEHGAGEVLMSPADISWGGLPDVLVQPDLFVVPPQLGRVRDWLEVEQLSLVIEVLSPSTARHDRFTKRRLYQEMQVPLYWLIDLDARRAEVWTSGGEVSGHRDAGAHVAADGGDRGVHARARDALPGLALLHANCP
jgi:Uma2 family endonuclease